MLLPLRALMNIEWIIHKLVEEQRVIMRNDFIAVLFWRLFVITIALVCSFSLVDIFLIKQCHLELLFLHIFIDELFLINIHIGEVFKFISIVLIN